MPAISVYLGCSVCSEGPHLQVSLISFFGAGGTDSESGPTFAGGRRPTPQEGTSCSLSKPQVL